ncbi:transport and golgi organization 4 [Dermatophagoides farinae]|nr:pleiotropic regulator 1-like [Dermatophagoides farinae]KAH7646827.1 pleiotropic regulator 1-like protein [Dermatophagoides farinae]
MDSIQTTPVRSRHQHIATPHRPAIRGPPTIKSSTPIQQHQKQSSSSSSQEQQQQQTNDNDGETMVWDESIPKHTRHTLVFRMLKRTHEMFISDMNLLPPFDPEMLNFRHNIKARDQYGPLLLNTNSTGKDDKKMNDKHSQSKALVLKNGNENRISNHGNSPIEELKSKLPAPINRQSQVAVVTTNDNNDSNDKHTKSGQVVLASGLTIAPRKPVQMPKPEWHAPWKLYRVISGHTGWIRCIAVEPGNEWFATGSNDRIIKIWDLASGTLKLSLTGHISPVRGLEVSPRQPYLFSCGEDKMVKCWDLEYNKVVRHYHGHLSGVYCLSLHPTLDILVTGGRDSVARVWDMRTKAQIHSLGGHSNTVASVFCQATDPQVVTGSHDSTIRLWDIVAGKTMATLTNHKKSVRALVAHPRLNTFCSGSINSLKQWTLPEGRFIQNLNGHDSMINALAVNDDNVLVSGGDNGSMFFWDWRTGYNFQRLQSKAQPGSIDSECGIFALHFDQSSSRLITGEADKTIKIYKEDEMANEQTHPIKWEPELLKRKRF